TALLRFDRMLRDGLGRDVDPAETAVERLGEPDGAVGAEGDAVGESVHLAAGRKGVLGNEAVGGDPADLVGPGLGEPQGAVVPAGWRVRVSGNIRTVPSGARRPTAARPLSVNQTAPSGATASSVGLPPSLSGNSVTDGLAHGSPAFGLAVVEVVELGPGAVDD